MHSLRNSISNRQGRKCSLSVTPGEAERSGEGFHHPGGSNLVHGYKS